MNRKYLPYILFSFCPISYSSFAQCTSATYDGSSFSSVPLSGISWNNVSNAQASDNNRATAGSLLGVLATVNTDYLKAENYGFSIPSINTICGIEVNIERRGSGIVIGSSISDNIIRLEKSGILTGSNYASATAWTGTDLKITYGGPADLWGTTWTPAEINSSDFGCLFSAKMNAGLASVFLQAEVDQVEITVYSNFVPLPIELLNFNVTLLYGQKVKVDWSTASEQNNFYFEVQRSINCIEWNTIKIVDGAGNSDQVLYYSTIDENPAKGISFYRLKQTDFDGKMNCSDMRSVNSISDNDITFVGPNPMKDIIRLTSSKNNNTALTLYLYDIHGNLVKKTQTFEIKKGIDFHVEIPIPELSQGMYFYKAISDVEVVSGKLIKN